MSRLKRGMGSRQAGGRERIMDTQELGVEGGNPDDRCIGRIYVLMGYDSVNL